MINKDKLPLSGGYNEADFLDVFIKYFLIFLGSRPSQSVISQIRLAEGFRWEVTSQNKSVRLKPYHLGTVTYTKSDIELWLFDMSIIQPPKGERVLHPIHNSIDMQVFKCFYGKENQYTSKRIKGTSLTQLTKKDSTISHRVTNRFLSAYRDNLD